MGRAAQSVRRPGDTTANQKIIRSIVASPTAWATSTAYSAGDVRSTTSGNRIYRCTTAGTSASSGTGPAGQGDAITDGTVTWEYAGGLNSTLPATGTDFGFPTRGCENFNVICQATGGTSVNFQTYLKDGASQVWYLDSEFGSAGTRTVNAGDTYAYTNTTSGADAILVMISAFSGAATGDAWSSVW